MSCKKDYGFIIIEMEDKESVRFFSEDGCTASIPGKLQVRNRPTRIKYLGLAFDFLTYV